MAYIVMGFYSYGTVRDYADEVALCRVLVRRIGVGLDGEAWLRNTGRVGDGQVLGRADLARPI